MTKKSTIVDDDKFDPVPCDLDAEIKENMKRPAYAKAHMESQTEFAMLNAMLEAQRKSKLSQNEIAAKKKEI